MTLTLRQLRRMMDISQDEVANLLGIHVQTYRKIEQNPDLATIEQAKKISTFFKTNYNDIFFTHDSSLTG